MMFTRRGSSRRFVEQFSLISFLLCAFANVIDKPDHKLGLANYTAPQIEEWMRICDEKGYIRPSVYQGQYNLLCRGCEDDIFPLVRKFGMAFNAYRYVRSFTSIRPGGGGAGVATLALPPVRLSVLRPRPF